MCGICGKISIEEESVNESLLKRMATVLIHRGPDDEGYYLKRFPSGLSVGLAHRRLSVIDLTEYARQPMCNEDGTVWIVYNGEIYNFPELRRDLLAKGHSFRSRSDTETIIHLYEEYGVDCLKYLRGMFAFGIWDEKERLLFLARDRVGKKPLFYYYDEGCLLFASEIKAILEDPIIKRRPDLIAIHHYLTYQSVPSPWSAFKGIRKLPPAHYLLYKNGQLTLKRYWELSYLPKFSVHTETERKKLKTELRDRLKEAVRIRLISDVPLGAFLSGGIDSSVVVALMSEVSKEPVKTFSIGFYEEDYDELRYARAVAERFNTEHREFRVKPEAVEILPKIVWHYNEPFADPSAIPTYYVSKIAREYVTVALNGDGGDENFAGYERYRAAEFAMRFDILPETLRRSLFRSLSRFLPASSNPKGLLWKIKRFSQALSMDPELRNAHWLCHFNNFMKSLLYTEEFRRLTEEYDSFEIILSKYREAAADNILDRILYSDVTLYLPDTLLVKVDIASMAHSLEARSPLLDHELMEFVAKLPQEMKLKRGRTKVILKELFKNLLPPEVIERKKMGFGVPLEHWFRGELREMVYDLLLDRRSIERGYFRKEFIHQMLDEHVSGRWNWQYQIYNLLMLELWHREFIDNSS
jgi:asparagine synthase (glutamine-hydrolysing)